MSAVAVAIGGGALLGAYASNQASNQAANSASNATNAQLGMFNTTNTQNAPYRTAANTALSQMTDLTAPGGTFSHQFNNADLNANLAPNYAFQLGQGQGAVNNQMNLTGGVNSGNTLKAINDYTQNFAGNAYQNAFNNYNAQNSNIFNRLSTIAGLGSAANTTTGNAASNAGTSIGNAMIAGGQAQAAGTMGMGNAITNGTNMYAASQMLNGPSPPASTATAAEFMGSPINLGNSGTSNFSGLVS